MQHVSGASESLFRALMVIARYLRDTSSYAITYGDATRTAFREFMLKHSGDMPATKMHGCGGNVCT